MARLPTPPLGDQPLGITQPTLHPPPPAAKPSTVPNCFSLLFQSIIRAVYAPAPPRGASKSLGRIAIIGAGLTGVSSAAHCLAHGFEVVVFEQRDRTGGVWNDVNSTSSLQLNSWLYRFHPSVIWSRAFPKQAEILQQVEELWKRYGLQSRTRFNYNVKRVQRLGLPGQTAWSIDDGREGFFDALIVAVGTCAQPSEQHWPSRTDHAGFFLHSSQLDKMPHPDLVAVIGSGASAVEAVEEAVKRGARRATIVARSDKWIIPRGLVPLCLISSAPWGWSATVSRLYEHAIKRFHYRDVSWLAPLPATGHGLDRSTPIVNDRFLDLVRNGTAQYLRGTVARFVPAGLEVVPHAQTEPVLLQADVVIDATGFRRPSMGFLPASLFPHGYELPALFLLNFSVQEPTLLFTNSAFRDAIGTVGHVHIGIYTRILLMFLLEPHLAPQPTHMLLWVDIVRYLKSGAPTDAFSFFTYVEMLVYLLVFHLIRPGRMRWALFNLYGIGHIAGSTRKPEARKLS